MIWTRTHTLGITLVLIIIAGSFAWYRFFSAPASYTSGTTVYEALSATNPAFMQANILSQSGKHSEARLKYEEARQSAADNIQGGQIAIKIAHSVRDSEGYMASIPLYKEISANAAFTPITRAYAVQTLGTLYATYADPRITTEVFLSQPYSDLYDATNVGASYTRLYEYGSQLYPLASSEVRAADWYADEIVRLSQEDKPDAQEISDLKDKIRAHLAAAEIDIQRISDNSNESVAIPGVYLRKASIAGKMTLLSDESFGDPEVLYRQVIEISQAKASGTEGYARLYYSAYLNNAYGVSRISDIEAILEPLRETSATGNVNVTVYIRNLKNGEPTLRSMIVSLANISTSFKKHVVSLGWTDQDLK